MKDNIAIKVSNVNKTFILPHEKQGSIKGLFVNVFNRKKTYEKQQALKDISFEIKKGEFFGIVGRNGSGKSTLLKLLAGIYTPDSGSIQVNGKLTPFIELGVGFNPELSGRENVFLNGALLGFSRKEMFAMYDEIVAFAELEKFMDQKLKNYSSGMQVRLAFSIAIRANTDILVLDEVLAVGDEAFQRKCYQYFAELKQKNKTVILVTHGMENVRKFCSRAMLVQDGKVILTDKPDKIADEYSKLNLLQTKQELTSDENKPYLHAKIIGKRLLHPSETLQMEIRYKALNNKPVFAKAYISINGQTVMATNPGNFGIKGMVTSDTKEHVALYSLSLANLNKGEFNVIALLEDVETKVNIASFGYNGETIIKIENPDSSNGGAILINQARMSLKK